MYYIYNTIAFILIFSSTQCGLKKTEIPSTNEIVLGSPIDSLAAEKIAVSTWLNVYGDKILRDTPYIFQQLDTVWIVRGTLKSGLKGGVPYIEILKKNGKVLNFTHGK
jgi:hypothetical protein